VSQRVQRHHGEGQHPAAPKLKVGRRERLLGVIGLASALAALVVAGTSQAASGTWERAWGEGVNGAAGSICTVAPNCLGGGVGGRGAEMSRPQSVAIDTGGHVYVADTLNNRIQKFDASGNWERAWGRNVNGGGVFGVCTVASSCQAGTSGGLGGELNGPVGIAVDSSGNVYVADATNNRIQKFDSSGAWERTWGNGVNGGAGFEVCTVASSCQPGAGGGLGGEMSNPNGVAVDSGGQVYVADAFNNRIQKFDSAGTWQRAWGNGVSGGGGFEVCTFAVSCVSGTPGVLGGEMVNPQGVAADSGGRVYVADTFNNRIQRFDSSGTWQRAWGGAVNLTSGGSVCTAASGDTCQAGTSGGLGGQLSTPQGVATDSGGNVYVADSDRSRIQKYDGSGSWQRTWGGGVNGGGGFEVCTVASSCQTGFEGGSGGAMNNLGGVAADAAGHVYVGDTFNNRIQKFDSAGTWERAWGKGVNLGAFGVCTVAASCLGGGGGGQGGQMSFPEGAAVDSGGNVYVADTFNNRIQKFDSAGNWERAWGKGVNGGPGFGVCTVAATCQAGATGGLGGELNAPRSIAIDSGGHVYVADSFNNRIQRFDSSGNWERAWGKDVNGGGGDLCTSAANCLAGAGGGLGGEMASPLGISVDSSGNVYVADQNNLRIQKFGSSGTWERAWGGAVNLTTGGDVCTAASGDTCQAGTYGALGGEMATPWGTAVDSGGHVYVADAGNSRIERFDSSGTWERAWGKNVNGGGGFGICTVASSCQAGTTGGLGGEMNAPVGVAADAGGHIYVAEAGNSRIQRFDSSGTWERAWGKNVNGGGVFGVCTVAASCHAGVTGGLGGELDGPQAVAADSLGNLYVAEEGNQRVQKFADPVVPPPPGPEPTPTQPPGVSSNPTGQRAAALKKCRKKHGRARKNCIKKAKKLPV
jgi:tripartite motif-containing protein 71